MDTIFSTIDFTYKLKLKYKEYLKPEIINITMIQSQEAVWLETTELTIVEGDLEKQTTRRINLDFIKDGENDENDELFFNPEDPIEKNVIKFIDEMSPYSIINTTDLFHDEASKKINKKFNTFGVNK